jgi:hypothetical protein
VQFSVPDVTINARKGGSTLTAQEIRDNVNNLAGTGNLDVNADGSANFTDGILVTLVQFSVPDATINARKGSSALTAQQIRDNVNTLAPPPAARPAPPLPAPATPSEKSAPSFAPLFSKPPKQPASILDSDSDQDGSNSGSSFAGSSSAGSIKSTKDATGTDEAFVTTQLDVTMDLLN